LISVPITIVIILALTMAAVTSIALLDNLVFVNAQPSPSNTTQPLTPQDEDEDAIVRQGTVTSEQDPLPGHEEHQMASILPPRQDGSIYTGVLTFTATEPVEVVVLNVQTLNETEQAILNGTEDGELGTLITSQLDNQTSLSLSYITPSYVGSPVPLPGLEGQQRATILPLTQDGSIYSGVLTYTASEPVNVVILNVQNLNETERAILNATEDDGELGPLLTAQLDNETSLAIAQITPDYGDSPAPSASIPFAGNAVWLHLAEDTPFVATYVVSAQTQQAETMNNISNLTATAAAEEGAAADEEEAAADEEEAAGDGAGNTTAPA
jgi:hypothetical protein